MIGLKLSLILTLQGHGDSNYVEVFSGVRYQFKLCKLTPSTSYWFRLAAVNSHGKRWTIVCLMSLWNSDVSRGSAYVISQICEEKYPSDDCHCKGTEYYCCEVIPVLYYLQCRCRFAILCKCSIHFCCPSMSQLQKWTWVFNAAVGSKHYRHCHLSQVPLRTGSALWLRFPVCELPW